MFRTDDTIVAIATPPGRGGIGVVRISGPAAPEIVVSLLNRETPLTPRHATFGRISDPVGAAVVDQVVATWFAAPHSYTGEDVVEISGHGSPVLLSRIVELALNQGARLAEPGEFTLRAYLAGRLDLPQAEAVADLVNAVTPLQARAAMDQLEGTLTARIRAIDAALFDLAARLEASLDFPEEGFHFISREDAVSNLDAVVSDLDRLLTDGRAGRVLREGRTVAIVGRPNAGKSSLFNALAGAARAIVTDVPGTTRDLVTEQIDIAGIPVTVVDTAGLREARDPIEAEGVRRAREAQGIASLTIVVIDGSAPVSVEDRDLIAAAPGAIIVQSKADLPVKWAPDMLGLAAGDVIAVSARTAAGMAELRRRISSRLTTREDLRDVPAITNLRHLTLVGEARTAVAAAIDALRAGATEELVLTDLGRARSALEEISGRRTIDDLLVHIFTRFCIGK